jgi:DNA-binding GntR family transcriptional regulator
VTSTNAFGHPLAQPSFVDLATSEIRRSILSGQLGPGRALSLRGLAGQLGISFIPVREALRGLEREGLVVINPGRSASVAPLDPDDLRSLCQLRRRIEPELATSACSLITPTDLDEQEHRLDAAHQKRNQPHDRYEAHRELLRALLRPSATAWDLRLLQMLWYATERYLRFGLDHADHATIQETAADTLKAAQYGLLRAFRGRDPQEAAMAVLHHVDWVEHTAARALAAAI